MGDDEETCNSGEICWLVSCLSPAGALKRLDCKFYARCEVEVLAISDLGVFSSSEPYFGNSLVQVYWNFRQKIN